MVVCVGESRSSSNFRAVTKAIEALLKEERHDSLSKKVMECLRECGRWPSKIEEKFPVVAEVKGLGQVDHVRTKLVEGLKEVLGLGNTPKVVSSTGSNH